MSALTNTELHERLESKILDGAPSGAVRALCELPARQRRAMLAAAHAAKLPVREAYQVACEKPDLDLAQTLVDIGVEHYALSAEGGLESHIAHAARNGSDELMLFMLMRPGLDDRQRAQLAFHAAFHCAQALQTTTLQLTLDTLPQAFSAKECTLLAATYSEKLNDAMRFSEARGFPKGKMDPKAVMRTLKTLERLGADFFALTLRADGGLLESGAPSRLTPRMSKVLLCPEEQGILLAAQPRHQPRAESDSAFKRARLAKIISESGSWLLLDPNIPQLTPLALRGARNALCNLLCCKAQGMEIQAFLTPERLERAQAALLSQGSSLMADLIWRLPHRMKPAQAKSFLADLMLAPDSLSPPEAPACWRHPLVLIQAAIIHDGYSHTDAFMTLAELMKEKHLKLNERESLEFVWQTCAQLTDWCQRQQQDTRLTMSESCHKQSEALLRLGQQLVSGPAGKVLDSCLSALSVFSPSMREQPSVKARDAYLETLSLYKAQMLQAHAAERLVDPDAQPAPSLAKPKQKRL